MRRTGVMRAGAVIGLLVAAAALSAADDPKPMPAGAGTDDDPIVIVMVDFKFVDKKGGADLTDKSVEIKVGQTVVWKNEGDSTHTASSDKKDADGKRLFDLKVSPGMTSKKLLVDEKLYKAFGGGDDGKVDAKYVCKPHAPDMKSKLVLVKPKQ